MEQKTIRTKREYLEYLRGDKYSAGLERVRTRIEESIHYVGFSHQQEVINETSNNHQE